MHTSHCTVLPCRCVIIMMDYKFLPTCFTSHQAILSHLVKCIAGEVAVVRDVEAGEGGARRHLSRTISVTGSTAKDTIVAGRDGGRDYTEINSVPPLPLYSLLSADLDTSYKGGEEAGKAPEGEGAQKSGEDQYTDLFQVGGGWRSREPVKGMPFSTRKYIFRQK